MYIQPEERLGPEIVEVRAGGDPEFMGLRERKIKMRRVSLGDEQ